MGTISTGGDEGRSEQRRSGMTTAKGAVRNWDPPVKASVDLPRPSLGKEARRLTAALQRANHGYRARKACGVAGPKQSAYASLRKSRPRPLFFPTAFWARIKSSQVKDIQRAIALGPKQQRSKSAIPRPLPTMCRSNCERQKKWLLILCLASRGTRRCCRYCPCAWRHCTREGMTQVARDAGLSRESLYKALGENGNRASRLS
jgi:hypothetical protein